MDEVEAKRMQEAVIARMRELLLTQKDLVDRSGFSDATIRPLMQGKPGNYRPVTLGRISQALDWTADSLERIARGEEPVPDGLPARKYDDLALQLAELSEKVDRLFDLLIVTAQPEAATDDPPSR